MIKHAAVVVLATALIAAAPPAKPAVPTYAKDIAPILNDRCVGCHRPGEIGPMALTTYKEVRPFVKAIREAVAERKMPPWHADPSVGHFANDRRLSEDQVRTVLLWANNGAPEGNPKDLPPPPKFEEGWRNGRPDIEFTIPKPFEVPAEGVVDYQYMITPTSFTEDKWVNGAEVRAGDRSVVHHVIVFVLPPEGEQFEGQSRIRFGAMCPQARPTPEDLKKLAERARSGRGPRQMGEHLTGWAPGLEGGQWPEGAGLKIRAGSRLMFQLHYTPSGKAAVDRTTKVGLRFAKGPVTHTIHTVPISNMQIALPPNEANYEATSCYTLARDIELLSFMPHMHLRGKDFTYRVTLPDGRTQTLLSVPRYDFGWQTTYRLADPLLLPKGTRIDCTAHFDNSVRNKANPNPNEEVRWGDQTWEEMMIGWVTFKAPIPPPVSASN